jgi:hypothetical protein
MEKRKIELGIVIVFVLFLAGVSSAAPLQGISLGTADQPLGSLELIAGIVGFYPPGGVIRSWPVTISGDPWGITYDRSNNTIWAISFSGEAMYEYLLNGIPTGRSHSLTWSPAAAGDGTINWNTGMLWVVDLGTDNCIHEIDPYSGVTGNSICPAFSIYQRGLAYDPDTDTWFAGSWDDQTIHHFNSSGAILDEVNVGLNISGLAYNPLTKHLFVMTNANPNLLYVLDAANSYALVRQLSLPELGPNEGAGLEIDSNGKLWLVNQGTDTVYQIESGETTNLGGYFWSLWNPAPFRAEDAAVVAYKGRIYYVGGYGSGGKVGIYNPSIDFWTVGALEPSPNIVEPVDGCLGLNSSGKPVIVLFPYPTGLVSGVLHRYNISANSWDTPPVPSGFPATGQWAHKIVSMLTFTGQNVCYISGGASPPRGGNLNTLWAYYPASNTITNLGDFTHHPAEFNFHASWYVPWIGSGGRICVAGGVDSTLTVISDTQCYDLGTASFLLPNSDLPKMPYGIWGAADLSMMDGEGSDYQLWVVNGAHASLGIWKGSIYYSSLDEQWHDGPSSLYGTYRLGGATDTRLGTMHTIGGWNSGLYNQVLAPTYTRLVTLLRPNGGVVPSGLSYTVQWSAPLKASKYSLMYSKNSGTTWNLIANNITGRRYEWNVPIATKRTNTWRLKITAYDASGKKVGTDNSNSNFKVAIASITSPNGGETLTSGGSHNITWQTNPSGTTISKVILSYTNNGGAKWIPLFTYSGTNPGSHSWTIPMVTVAKTKCKVKVVLQDSTGKTIDSDTSDFYFTIQP